MASDAKEGTGESGSAARAEPPKAAVVSECPICLGAVRKPAFVAYCMHQFCFRCIRQWAQGREDCPVCRQSLEQVLHSVRGDDDYELFVVGLPTRLCRRMAMDRARRRRPQCRYNLRRRPATNPPAAGRSEPRAGQNEPRAGQNEPRAGRSEPRAGQNEPRAGQNEPAGTGNSQGQGAAPGHSRILAQPAPATGTSWEPSHRTGPGAPLDTHSSTE